MTNWRTCLGAFLILILILASCGDAPEAGYESVDQIMNAMDAAGYECVPNGAGGAYGALIDSGGCDWPPPNHPEYPSDALSLLIYSTERDRLREMVRIQNIGCGAIPSAPESIAYVHGSTWAVMSGYAESPLEVMTAIAEGIGGEATATNCAQLAEGLFGSDPQGPLVMNLEARTVADLKALLGEP